MRSNAFTLAITPFLLASSVNLLWCQMCPFYCPLMANRYIIPPEVTEFTHSAAHSSKRLKPLPDITLLYQGYC